MPRNPIAWVAMWGLLLGTGVRASDSELNRPPSPADAANPARATATLAAETIADSVAGQEADLPPEQMLYDEDDWSSTPWSPPGCYWAGSTPCDPCTGGYCSGCSTLVWARFEALLWWQQGRNLPPLVTTDPAAEPLATAGILPGATVLLGNGTEASDMSGGARADVGLWTDTQQTRGVGLRLWGLGRNGFDFQRTSAQEAVLAIPFSTINPAANDALVIAYPGLRAGEINFSANSYLLGSDFYGRFLLGRNGISRIDLVTGYQFSRLHDSITMRSQSTNIDPLSIDVGAVTTVVDQFAGTNDFHGGIVGIVWERDCGCWNTQLAARTALGVTRQRMLIDGSFTFDTPAAPPVVTAGGLFAAPSNLGDFGQTEFSTVSEFSATCAYRIGCCTHLKLGYSFTLWSKVQRAGDAIDPVIDLGVNPTRPVFNFSSTSYWMQGLNVGFEREF